MITAGFKACPPRNLVDRFKSYLYLFHCKDLLSIRTLTPEGNNII
jgi:hypothetical protein